MSDFNPYRCPVCNKPLHFVFANKGMAIDRSGDVPLTKAACCDIEARLFSDRLEISCPPTSA
jgi:hypothetical protein